MRQLLEINGNLLNLEIAGPANGPVVLFLHHGLGTIRSWQAQIPVFSAAGYQVITYDRWGHGSSAPRKNWSMPGFEPDLADLEVILGELGHREVSLIGHSDGGNIALLYALAHPDQVSCLVIIAAHIYVEQKMIRGIYAVRDKFEGDLHFRKGLESVHGENTVQLFWGWFESWTNPLLLDWDMRSELSNLISPTLVVQGLEDEHATSEHARDLADAIPGAELWLVPGANHMLPQQMPEKFNQRTLNFLEQVLTVPASHG